jgi:hypothetical protein
MKVVRALRFSGAAIEKNRVCRLGFSGGARKAMEKSAEQDGDEGVTMMAGNGDFSLIWESDTSSMPVTLDVEIDDFKVEHTPSGAGTRM